MNEILQTLGLLLDVIGVIIIANYFKKTEAKERSSFGLITNENEVLSSLRNEGKCGSYFLIGGFALQLLGLWAETIFSAIKGI